ncbi:MAG: sulfatase [Candidatus Omnitrophota bacterium]
MPTVKRVLISLAVLSQLFLRAVIAEERQPNVLLIVLDTTRPDRFGCYGYGLPTTPNIDRVSEDSVIFDGAISVIPLTTPSHVSIMTGLHPGSHLVYRNSYPMSGSFTTMAEILSDAGYLTAASVSTRLLKAQLGFDQGFDCFSGVEEKAARAARKGDVTLGKAMDWLRNNYREKFFLWVHLYDPHLPYLPPKEFGLAFNPAYEDFFRKYNRTEVVADDLTDHKENDGADGSVIKKPSKKKMNKRIRFPREISPEEERELKEAYDAEIAFDDHCLGELFSFLRETGMYDNTIIIIMADHGEMLYEKENYFGHHRFLHQEALRIPLIMKFPGIPGRRIPARITTVDVLPTLLDALDLTGGAAMDGMSYWGLIKNGGADADPGHTIVLTHFLKKKKKDHAEGPGKKTAGTGKKKARVKKPLKFGEVFVKAAVFKDDWKLIMNRSGYEGPEAKLFDLSADGEENHDLAGTPGSAVPYAELRKFIMSYFESKKNVVIPAKLRKADRDTTAMQDLKSLGYLQ